MLAKGMVWRNLCQCPAFLGRQDISH